MTLTQDDIQAIGTIIDQKLNKSLDQKLQPIKRDIKNIKKTVETTAKLLDLEQMRQRRQIKRIEENLNLPSELH